jgi:hypothetical protein
VLVVFRNLMRFVYYLLSVFLRVVLLLWLVLRLFVGLFMSIYCWTNSN